MLRSGWRHKKCAYSWPYSIFLSVAVVSIWMSVFFCVCVRFWTRDCGTQLSGQKTGRHWSKRTAATELTGPVILKPSTMEMLQMCVFAYMQISVFAAFKDFIPLHSCHILQLLSLLTLQRSWTLVDEPHIHTNPLISDLLLVLDLLLGCMYAHHVHKYTDRRAPCHYSQSLLCWVCSCVYAAFF